VSSILAFPREALPTLRYFPNDTKPALGMTLLELTKVHYILQVFCVRQEDGGGVNRARGASDIVKAESSGEDPRATGGLVSRQIFLTLGLIKQSNTKQHTKSFMGLFYPLNHHTPRQSHGIHKSLGCTPLLPSPKSVRLWGVHRHRTGWHLVGVPFRSTLQTV